MSVLIRNATPDDAAAIVEIYAPYVLHTGISFETEVPSVEEYRGRIIKTQEFFPFFVLEEDGVVVGYSCAHFLRERKAYRWMCESTIYVHKDKQRSGYARMLYEKLLDALKRQGFCEVFAVIGCPNEPSERFHSAMGFTLAAEFPKSGYKLGRWWDVKYYSIQLNPRAECPAELIPYPELKA